MKNTKTATVNNLKRQRLKMVIFFTRSNDGTGAGVMLNQRKRLGAPLHNRQKRKGHKVVDEGVGNVVR